MEPTIAPADERALLAARIDAALPQTQCTRCGHAACRPYAEAVAAGEAINRCAPGGVAGILALARITSRPALPLDAAHGSEGPLQRARIDESRCIGCALCREACPVEAIVGGPKRVHTILSAWCTGCELCLPPCPVDCIVVEVAGRHWSVTDAEAARERFVARTRRAAAAAPTAPSTPSLPQVAQPEIADAARSRRQGAVAAALARARMRRAARTPAPRDR